LNHFIKYRNISEIFQEIFQHKNTVFYTSLITLPSLDSRKPLGFATLGNLVIPLSPSSTMKRRSFAMVGTSFWNCIQRNLSQWPVPLSLTPPHK